MMLELVTQVDFSALMLSGKSILDQPPDVLANALAVIVAGFNIVAAAILFINKLVKKPSHEIQALIDGAAQSARTLNRSLTGYQNLVQMIDSRFAEARSQSSAILNEVGALKREIAERRGGG